MTFGNYDDNVVMATSLSTCIIQPLAKASSLNLLAEDRARRRIERVSSSERERVRRSWVEYEEREFAWNPVKKGDGGEDDLLVGYLTLMVRGNMYLSDHHRDRSRYPKRVRRCR